MLTKVEMYSSSPRVRRSALKDSQALKPKPKSVRFLSIKPVIDDRPAVQDHLRSTSIVYARSSAASQPHLGAKLGQKQVTQLRLKDWQRYHWTWPPSPACRRPWLPPPPPPQPSPEGPGRSVSGSSDGRETITSFPPLSHQAMGQPMLRRPTRRLSLRTATVGDEVMDMLGNYLDLTPVNGYGVRGPGHRRRSRTFYAHHFPLLLEKKPFNEEDPDDNSKVVSHRQIQGRQTSEQKRRAEVARRCGFLERALTSLERAERDLEEEEVVEEVGEKKKKGPGRARAAGTGGVFVTELREEVFDPRVWPWNSQRYIS